MIVSGSKVWLPGPFLAKRVERLRPGATVWTWAGSRQVLRIHEDVAPVVEVRLSSGFVLELGEGQQVYTGGMEGGQAPEWVEAEYLLGREVMIYSRDGVRDWYFVTAVRRTTDVALVYSLEVDLSSQVVVGGVVVRALTATMAS